MPQKIYKIYLYNTNLILILKFKIRGNESKIHEHDWSNVRSIFSSFRCSRQNAMNRMMKYWRVRLTGRFLFLDGSSVTTGAGGGGGGGGGGSVGGSVGGSADAYRQSSSASPRGVVTGGYCGSSASTPHSHSTNGSYSVANPYTGSPTLYTSRKYTILSFFLSSKSCLCIFQFYLPIDPIDYSSSSLRRVHCQILLYKKIIVYF